MGAQTNGTKIASPSKSTSQAVLLAQAIRANDTELFASMVNRLGNNWQTISTTIKDLPTSEVLPLLRMIDKHLRQHGREIKNLELWLSWVNKILRIHSTHLATVPNLTEHFATITQWMENRVRHIDKLLQLQGKLSFMISAMPQQSDQWRARDEQPMIVFAADECQVEEEQQQEEDMDD
ncbi:hypothetical protein niasHT_000387 [Heterodera trifolii]|uniref:Small-subunit processome Utp12 domain-containing protein n=1 Tax=Heterodera trifolii TaxID=157864 RepID=A0ABD2M195_9BILA